MTPSADGKAELRRSVRAALAALDRKAVADQSDAIRRAIVHSAPWKSARTVMLFDPLPDEPDIAPLLGRALVESKSPTLPRIDWRSGGMTPARISDPAGDLVSVRGELRHPGAHCPAVDPAVIDLVLVPGVAFDRAGRRLGRGKGFYDRFLARLAPGCTTIGVCMTEQLVPAVPADGHDRPVIWLATPGGLQRAEPGGELP